MFTILTVTERNISFYFVTSSCLQLVAAGVLKVSYFADI